MKVLFQSRFSLFLTPGGDTIQLLKTKEYLEKLGVQVDISLELEPDVSQYDLIHIFNFTRPQETYLQAKNAKKYHKKVLLSPIFVDYEEYDKKGRSGIGNILFKVFNKYQIEYSKIAGRAIIGGEFHKGTFIVLQKGFKRTQKDALKYIDLFLPNSFSEWRRLTGEFNLSDSSYQIIPNAVDQFLFNPDNVKIDPEYTKYKGCILCVAQIDGRKNQFNLIQAMKDVPEKLVLIGKVARHHHKDFLVIKNNKSQNVYFLGEIPHHRLPPFFSLAKVHVLPSFFETTGLSSLEAAIMGCNIVVSDRGDVRDYFGEFAYYCEPDSVDSIRKAVLKAYSSPPHNDLRTHILKNFTWEITAEKTLLVYKSLI